MLSTTTKKIVSSITILNMVLWNFTLPFNSLLPQAKAESLPSLPSVKNSAEKISPEKNYVEGEVIVKFKP